MSAFSGCGKRGLLCIAVLGLPAAEASFVAERGLEGTGLIVVAPRLSCSMACEIFPDQKLNPCLLHGQANFVPLSQHGLFKVELHQGNEQTSQTLGENI